MNNEIIAKHILINKIKADVGSFIYSQTENEYTRAIQDVLALLDEYDKNIAEGTD